MRRLKRTITLIDLVDIKKHTSESEEILIQRAKADPREFNILYDRYFREIFRFVFSRVNDKENAADITSEVFLKALTHLNRFVYKGFPFSAWLYRIAINECNQWFRDKNHQRHTVLNNEMAKGLGEELLLDREDDERLMQKLAAAMQSLGLKDLQMIELRFFEKKSFKEIGYMLDMSENNVTVKTHRILKRMRKRISR